MNQLQAQKLVGKTVIIRKKSETDNIYPFPQNGQKATVIGNFPRFLLVEILPHQNPRGFNVSRPYRCTVPKHDIVIGEIVLTETDTKP